ncbi:SDR family oxidoreductase [Rhizobium sp. CSW-27]|uniref:SDR family oxidoreductase n=1 Tax=Rhizobium sp. CSW-27 TaxID=2839985 RepID=UPI001C023669|nr:SDR family oxidoreductase [Rhizobium sp. CSW-27]MBT9373278.1 SDR family oxidoreductase [Rhizobium sp. CSW-27]
MNHQSSGGDLGRIAGRVVVITGASSGIGEATAQAFARRGTRLVLAARDAQALAGVAAACRRLGADVETVPTDVTDSQAVRQLASRALAFGGLDIWVSNVGVGAVGSFVETPISAHEQVIRANLIGHMNDAHAALPIFIRKGRGVFINMISLGGFAAAPYAAAYSASKFGLRGFGEAIRAELADRPHIHVCDIYPAFVDTPGLRHGANYTGAAITAPPPVLDARRVAEAIVATAEQPRDTVMVGSVTRLVRLAHALAPNLSGRLMAVLMRRHFRRAQRVAITDGNLFSPPEPAGGIDGGFRSPSQRSLTTVLTAGLAAGVCAALVAGAVTRRPRHATPALRARLDRLRQ